MGKFWLWSVLVVIGLAALALYFHYRLPPGIEPKGEYDGIVAWVSLATAIVSLLTAAVSLIKTIVDARAKR